MAELDILKPLISKVAHGLDGKIITIYGGNNLGKTYQAVRAERPLVLCVESGLNAIGGVSHFVIDTWSTFVKIVKQLTGKKSAQAKEMYKTIVIDEVYALSMLCQRYVCDNEGDGCLDISTYEKREDEKKTKNLYKIYENVYWAQINLLAKAGYTVLFIGHAQANTKTGFISLKGDKRCVQPVIDNSDIVAYLQPNGVDENGKEILSSAYFVETQDFFARSRYPEMVEKIDVFTIENLEKAIEDAIQEGCEKKGIESVSFEEKQASEKVDHLSFEELVKRLNTIISLVAEQKGEESDELFKLGEIMESTLGVGKKISTATKRDTQNLELLLYDFEEALEEMGISIPEV